MRRERQVEVILGNESFEFPLHDRGKRVAGGRIPGAWLSFRTSVRNLNLSHERNALEEVSKRRVIGSSLEQHDQSVVAYYL